MDPTWEETNTAHLDMAGADDQMNMAKDADQPWRSAPSETSTVLPDMVDDRRDMVEENMEACRDILLAMAAERLLASKNSTSVMETVTTMTARSDTVATMVVATRSMTIMIS